MALRKGVRAITGVTIAFWYYNRIEDCIQVFFYTNNFHKIAFYHTKPVWYKQNGTKVTDPVSRFASKTKLWEKVTWDKVTDPVSHYEKWDEGVCPLVPVFRYYRSCTPYSSQVLDISSGQREDWTSPMWALRRKNIQILDCPIPPPIV